jgi:hypothetical protein
LFLLIETAFYNFSLHGSLFKAECYAYFEAFFIGRAIMTITRRQMLVGTTSVAALFSKVLGAAADQNYDEISRLYGEPDLKNIDLETARLMQEGRTRVPLNTKDFEGYISNSPLFQKLTGGMSNDYYHLLQWNALALDLTSQDHTVIAGYTDATYAEQFGPHRSSWALAIAHLAMFEAVNAIFQSHKSYQSVQAKILTDVGQSASAVNPKTASVRTAIAYAAYDVLSVLYKNKEAYIRVVFNKLIPIIDDDPMKVKLGAKIGSAATKEILALRKYDPGTQKFNDGSKAQSGVSSLTTEPRFTDFFKSPTQPRDWDIDPVSQNGVALGGHWSDVMPFATTDLHLPAGPPAESDKRFKDALDEVRKLGGDPAPPTIGARFKTPTSRKGTVSAPLNASNETLKGIYWAYDGTALLCAPPRLYNELALSVAFRERPIRKVDDLAQYLALINVAMADAGIGAWTGKYKFHHARPVTYIRKVDPDSVVLGSKNKEFTPLGAQVSNGGPQGANLTPPFPAYPSGHATFGGALFQAMRMFFKGETAFKFVSDEYNGVNRGPVGPTRPKFERDFKSFKEAEVENGESRIWLGIHWNYDAEDGIAQGQAIAKDVFTNAFSA